MSEHVSLSICQVTVYNKPNEIFISAILVCSMFIMEKQIMRVCRMVDLFAPTEKECIILDEQ